MPSTSSGSVTVSFPRYDLETILQRLEEALPTLRQHLPLRRMVLFGSQATKRATAASDIDLLVVYEGPKREEAFKIIKRSIDLYGVEPHVYTFEEATDLQERLDQMTRDGIVLFDETDGDW